MKRLALVFLLLSGCASSRLLASRDGCDRDQDCGRGAYCVVGHCDDTGLINPQLDE